MHDSDLVETLALLTADERKLLFSFLEKNSKSSPFTVLKESTSFCQYIFDAVDERIKGLAKQKLWSVISANGPLEEELLDNHLNIGASESREILKKEFLKRIPSTKKDLVELLSSLTPAERNSLCLSLNQRAFPEKATVHKLVQHVCTCLNVYELTLSEERVYRAIFQSQHQVSGKLPKHRTDTLKVVKQFIAREVILNPLSELQELVLLQRFFQERNCPAQYQRVRNQIQKQKTEDNQWSSGDYYQFFLSEVGDSFFQGKKNETNTDQNLWESIQSLDEYYLVERLWLMCQLLNQNQITPLALPPKEEWWHFDIKSPHLKWFFDKPLGKIFLLAINLLSDETGNREQALQEFTEFLRKHEKNVSLEILNSFEVFAINYGVRQMNKGLFSFGELVFEIEQRRVESGRIYTDGAILSSEFQSIVTQGLRLGKNDWVKEFIENHKKKIVGMMPSSEYYEFCLALYYYYVQNLLGALHILMNAEYDDLQSKMIARMLEIKVLCELELSGQTKLRIDEQLDARIEAGILFFFRLKDLPNQKRVMCKRFMDFMKKIIRAKENHRWGILEKIRKQVETIDLIAERQWLLKTIDQYLAKAKH